MEYSAGALARLAGVSIRTLHHYDAVGLLRPTARTRAGHRRYGAADVERLHRILVYRQLGFELATIGELIADEGATGTGHLERQRALLREQRARLDRMLEGVERLMNARKTGVALTAEELREVFGAFDPGAHAAEAEARWGSTDAYRESRRRSAKYGKQEWIVIREEAASIEAEFAALLRAGEEPTSAAARALAERHRQHIERWFYDCPPEMHRGLGELYVADDRFAQHYESIAAGLAQYVSAAVRANAEHPSAG